MSELVIFLRCNGANGASKRQTLGCLDSNFGSGLEAKSSTSSLDSCRLKDVTRLCAWSWVEAEIGRMHPARTNQPVPPQQQILDKRTAAKKAVRQSLQLYHMHMQASTWGQGPSQLFGHMRGCNHRRHALKTARSITGCTPVLYWQAGRLKGGPPA